MLMGDGQLFLTIILLFCISCLIYKIDSIMQIFRNLLKD